MDDDYMTTYFDDIKTTEKNITKTVGVCVCVC